MATTRVLERSQEAIGPQERVRTAFPAQVGVVRPELIIGVLVVSSATGFWLGVLPLLLLFALIWKYRVVAVTDGAVIVFKATLWRPATPRDVLMQIPLEGGFELGREWLWSELLIDGRHYWVARQYKGAVAAAVAAATHTGDPAVGVVRGS